MVAVPGGTTAPPRDHRNTSVSDFSSSEYWSARFSHETSFEWLLPSGRIIPFIIDHLAPALSTRPQFRGLHIGCGTSDLGRTVQKALQERNAGEKVEIVDADYVAGSISTPGVLPLDCLDGSDLRQKSPEEGWDMILDKSTADAISCGPPISRTDDNVLVAGVAEEIESAASGKDEEPLDVLLRNMNNVTRIGALWISISYSSTRFQMAHLRDLGWEVEERRFLASTSMPEGRRVRDDKTGEERVVWEPETGVWGWVLKRV